MRGPDASEALGLGFAIARKSSRPRPVVVAGRFGWLSGRRRTGLRVAAGGRLRRALSV